LAVGAPTAGDALTYYMVDPSVEEDGGEETSIKWPVEVKIAS
jgi:hypothetical protein